MSDQRFIQSDPLSPKDVQITQVFNVKLHAMCMPTSNFMCISYSFHLMPCQMTKSQRMVAGVDGWSNKQKTFTQETTVCVPSETRSQL